jgi:hypothetical protein
MAFKIIIKEEARLDSATAYYYYENERRGLGEEFLEELEKRYHDLESHPLNYGFIDDQQIIRDVKIDRFPYVIIFEVIDSSVIVYAVHNTYRHPKRRLRNK